jgi:hypothetical protein
MQSLYYFVVEPVDGKRYTNTRSYGDKEFIISTSQEDHTVTNRLAKVVNVPFGYSGPIAIGDDVIVHHNVFRKMFDMRGKEVDSYSFIRENLYYLDDMQLYAYRHPNEDWEPVGRYCFVEPIKVQEDTLVSKKGENVALWGSIVYPNDRLRELGLSSGDIISFQPDSEYEFRIDDRILYRMYDSNVCLKQGN